MLGSAAVRPATHGVHFYEDDADVFASVVAHLEPAVRAGDAALVLAVAPHRTAIQRALAATGADLAAAERRGALRWLDATDLAAALTVGAGVDAGAFEQSVAAPVRQAAARGAGVPRVYGEIVAVMWGDGHVAAALELERRWNDLIAGTPISLLCGYPASLMANEESAGGYPQICAAHDHVVAAAPVADEAEVCRRFPRAPSAPRHARRFVVETLHRWGRAHLVDAAVLVVSELAGNAVRHARSEFTVSLTRIGAAVRLTVGDRRAEPPRPRVSHPWEPHGRGMLLVDVMSAGWGYAAVPGGKLVWADLIDGSDVIEGSIDRDATR